MAPRVPQEPAVAEAFWTGYRTLPDPLNLAVARLAVTVREAGAQHDSEAPDRYAPARTYPCELSRRLDELERRCRTT